MSISLKRVLSGSLAVACTCAGALAGGAGGSAATPAPAASTGLPGGYKHLVVIYEENHSFDNLYGRWGNVGGWHVDGVRRASTAQKTQLGQDGTAFACLPQNDVNLASPPLANTCQDAGHNIAASNFVNRPFKIDNYIAPADKTCPAPGVFAEFGVLKDSPGAEPGGCTRDIVHRFYQEQYQLNGGRQNRYTTGSDAIGLTQGTYRTRQLPIWTYLHGNDAPHYVLADHFFQAAFGGSFLNHQWLIAARSPLDTDKTTTYTLKNGVPDPASYAKNSVLDANGMPTKYPLYTPTKAVVDDKLTQACTAGGNNYDLACGDYAVNTIQPATAPHAGGAYLPLIDDNQYPNIGDELTGKGISWNWYSGGWDAAESGHAGPLFQYHHQPFNYFANYAPGTTGRTHLQDETKFISAAQNGTLPTVSFVKPYGAENEHPGYASESTGSDHLVDLLKAIENGPQAGNTLVVVTYDEFGGQWDHVSPPSIADGAAAGTADVWGPGTRIPALVIARSLKHSGVDHTSYDTTSILATIERSYGLDPLSSRDAAVNDLSNAVAAGGR
ncbi:MAG: alkaline phosphatase family protein [Marmoricola sp.]